MSQLRNISELEVGPFGNSLSLKGHEMKEDEGKIDLCSADGEWEGQGLQGESNSRSNERGMGRKASGCRSFFYHGECWKCVFSSSSDPNNLIGRAKKGLSPVIPT